MSREDENHIDITSSLELKEEDTPIILETLGSGGKYKEKSKQSKRSIRLVSARTIGVGARDNKRRDSRSCFNTGLVPETRTLKQR